MGRTGVYPLYVELGLVPVVGRAVSSGVFRGDVSSVPF